ATKARYLAIIGDETNRLERLIGDLLDLARLEGGGGSLRFEDVPVADLFARVVERHEPAYTDADVTIATAIDDPAARVYGDRDRAASGPAGDDARRTPAIRLPTE